METEVSKFFPHARGTEKQSRADLAQVLHYGRAALRAVDREASGDGHAEREEEIPHPGHRQIGQHTLTMHPLERDDFLGRDHEVAVSQHHALRPARRTGGVADHCQVLVRPLGDLIFDIARVTLEKRAATLLHGAVTQQIVDPVVPHPAWVLIDHALQLRAVRFDIDQLVGLLLVLD